MQQEETPRRLLLAVEDSEGSERLVRWSMEHLYRPDTEVHLLHVMPRFEIASTYGGPALDLSPMIDPGGYQGRLHAAENFLAKRFGSLMTGITPPPVAHIVKYDTDSESIGAVIVRKAQQLQVAAVVVAHNSRSHLQQLFMGSVTKYCLQNCKRPVVVVKP
jgi:nucleotide-binding universal stress UspA family protein